MLKFFTDKFYFNIFFILAVFAFSVSAQAQQTGDNVPMPPHNRPNLLQLLDLSPEQIKLIRQIQRESRPEMQEAQRAQREAQRALNQAIYAETADKNLVEQRIKELTEAQRRTVETRARTEFRVREVLTPDQLIRFRELKMRLEERMRQRKNAQEGAPNRNFPNRPLFNGKN